MLRGSMGLGGGPPLVADFDRDGIPDFGVAGFTSYTAFSLRCFAMPLPAGCKAPGVLWQIPFHDTSGVVAASAFDSDGDGWLEMS